MICYMCDWCVYPAIIIITRYSSSRGGGLTSCGRCGSDDGRRLRHSSLKPVWSSRRLSPGLWWLGLHDQLRVDVSTPGHCRLSQHPQDLLPLRRPTHHTATAACPRDDRGNIVCICHTIELISYTSVIGLYTNVTIHVCCVLDTALCEKCCVLEVFGDCYIWYSETDYADFWGH